MNSQDQDQIAQASAKRDATTITLETPIKRGETEFNTVSIRKPFGPALRGMSISRLLNEADYDAYAALIPRITSPMITKQDIESGALDVADLVKMISEIGYFFMPKAERARIDASQTE